MAVNVLIIILSLSFGHYTISYCQGKQYSRAQKMGTFSSHVSKMYFCLKDKTIKLTSRPAPP